MIKLSCCIPGGSLMPEGVAGVPQSPAQDIIDKCRYLLSIGYDCTECTGGMLASLTDEQVEYLLSENKKSSLRIVAANSLFPGNWKLASSTQDKTEYLAHARRIFKVLGALSAKYAVFGSGAARSLIAEDENSRSALYDFVRALGALAAEYGMKLVIEPLRKRESNIFVTVPETYSIIDELADENVLLLYDAFHMAEEGTDLSAVAECSKYLRHCHIAEAPNRSVPGSADSGNPEYVKTFAAELNRCGYDGAVSIECGFKDFREDAKNGIKYLREIFSQATKFTFTARRTMTEEPIFLKPTEGKVLPEITSVYTEDGRMFPAGAKGDGIIAVVSAYAGETVSLTAAYGEVPGSPKAELITEESKVDVTIRGCHFSDYVFDKAILKPFFGKVYDDCGNPFTRLDLTVKEHPHQRSLFIAVGDVNGVDCWNENAGCGKVRNREITDILSSSAYASFTAHNVWTNNGDEPLIDEATTYTVYNQSESCRALDIETTFTASYGDVTFGPTKEAGPLGIRLRDELRADIGTGILSNSWGGVGEEECWSRSAEWCDYSGNIADSGFMGVTVFDNMNNERFPTAWHIRAYGLFAANNLYFKGGFDIPAGTSITYRFRVLFRKSEMSREEIADRFVVYSLGVR